MVIICRSQTLKLESALCPSHSPAEEKDNAAQLREVEKALLCQALGGQLPQPGSQQRLQHYLAGELTQAEDFEPLYYPVGYGRLV